MLDIQYALLIVLAFILIFISVELEREHDYWNIISIFLSALIFIVLIFGTLNIETPYQIYNATSGNIETGYQSYGLSYSLMYLWLGFAIAAYAYFFLLLFKPFFIKKGWLKKT
jgi:hypothetical protein